MSSEILEMYSSSKAIDFQNMGGGNTEKQTSPALGCQEETTNLVDVKLEKPELLEIEPQKPIPENFPEASLALLQNYQSSRFKGFACKNINVPTNVSPCKVSTDAIIRMASERFIKSCSQRSDGISKFSHPFCSTGLQLSEEETREVELVEYLLASADRVGQHKFNDARKFLDRCVELSSDRGSPVQRLVYYFCGALCEKIDRQTGLILSNTLGKETLSDLEETVMSSTLASIAFHKKLPFSQVSQFAGVQAVIEHVAEAKKVHVIDLFIMKGSKCIILMQALAARDKHPLEHLKITAIGTKCKAKIEETGERLISFAKSVNLKFTFNVVMVADMLDLKEELFELDAEEVVAIQSSYLLSTMIAQSDRLESLMRVMRKINPCVMVVIESEASNNSPVFVKRFTDALFYYGAYFDSLEDCMDHDDPNRPLIELSTLSPAIYNVVAAEGQERTTRHVNMSVWRAFFARFRMVELELSTCSLYQASLLVKRFACWGSCTIDRNAKCLITAWKGTPIHSLSVWKFN